MMSIMSAIIQGLEQLDDEEKHRVLDSVYAFYALKQDPTFRLSDVTAIVAKVAEVLTEVGPDLMQKGAGMMQQGISTANPATADIPFVGEAPPIVMEAPPEPIPGRPPVPQVDYPVAAIVQSMAERLDPETVANMFADMLSFHLTFGGLPTQWAKFGDNPEEVVHFLAQQIPNLDEKYVEEVTTKLRELLD